MFLGTEITDANELNEALGVQRVRMVYEDMVFKVTGRAVQFPIFKGDLNSKNWERNRNMFRRIYKHLRAIAVTPETYMTVMFSRKEDKATPDKYGKTWKYPYLQWLSSDKAFEIFPWKARAVASKYGYRSTAAVIHKSPTDYTACFRGAFSNGFHILNVTKRGAPLGFLHRLPNLYATFLAYGETFRPEFVVTCTSFTDYFDTKRKGHEEEIIFGAVQRYVNDTLERGWKKPKYFTHLVESREKVRREEEKSLRRRGVMSDKKGTDLWLMLQ